jgi:ectoine hydroxylase-related dioxygenase (phytanoyl-CoA dioxygenase family)
MNRQNGTGFWIEQSIISQGECVGLLESLASSGGKRSPPGVRNLMNHPAVAAAASDPRLLDIAHRALGRPAIPFRATLFEKSMNARWVVVWHQDRALPLESTFDSAEWGPWSLKGGVSYALAPEWALARVVALRIHLDSSMHDNAPLRVIPKSHLAGVMSEAEVLEFAGRHQPVECLVAQGGILVMRPLLIHASTKPRSNAPRRVLHIEYADSLELAPGIRLAIT